MLFGLIYRIRSRFVPEKDLEDLAEIRLASNLNLKSELCDFQFPSYGK